MPQRFAKVRVLDVRHHADNLPADRECLMIRTDCLGPVAAPQLRPAPEGRPVDHQAAALPTALHGMRNGGLPVPPGSKAHPSSGAEQPLGHIRSVLDWAPCGFDTADKLKASFRDQLTSLSTDIDSARGHPFKIDAAYAAFAEKSRALLDACTPERIHAADVERIASVVRQRLEAAARQKS